MKTDLPGDVGMSALSVALMVLGSIAVGTGVGIALVNLAPRGAKAFAKHAARYVALYAACGVVMFAGLAILAFTTGLPLMGALLAVFAAAELAVLVYHGLGLDGRTPEERMARAEAYDPTDFWYYLRSTDGNPTDEENQSNH